MKIAFDCKGTLIGFNEEKVLKLFHILESQGHELFVWSNSIGYAFEAVKTHALNVGASHTMYKYTKGEAELEEIDVMDIAIEDDTSQTYLAANRFIFVHEIPDNVEEFAKQFLP